MLTAIFSVTLMAITQTTAVAEGSLVIGWNNITAVFAERYATAAAGGYDQALAERQLSRESTLKLDPTLTVRGSRESLAARSETQSETQSETRTIGLSQGSPFGTELGVSISRQRAPNLQTGQAQSTEAHSLQLKQNLLKNGPWYGLASDTSAELRHTLRLVRADLALEQALLQAFDALASSQLAEQTLAARHKALERAKAQHESVQQLVASGYRAKADLLISEASLLRTQLNHSEAVRNAEVARRKLLTSLFLAPDSPGLQIADDSPSPEWLRRLEGLAWPTPPPQARVAQLESDLAYLQAGLARRDDLPELSVSLNFTKTRPLEETDSTRLQRTLEVALTAPLLGSIRRDSAQIASLEAEQASAKRQAAEREAATLQSDLSAKLQMTEERLKTAELLFKLASQTLNIEQEKYADGKSTIAEVRRVQEDVENAQLALIAAGKDRLMARVAWAQATGKLAETLP